MAGVRTSSLLFFAVILPSSRWASSWPPACARRRSSEPDAVLPHAALVALVPVLGLYAWVASRPTTKVARPYARRPRRHGGHAAYFALLFLPSRPSASWPSASSGSSGGAHGAPAPVPLLSFASALFLAGRVRRSPAAADRAGGFWRGVLAGLAVVIAVEAQPS